VAEKSLAVVFIADDLRKVIEFKVSTVGNEVCLCLSPKYVLEMSILLFNDLLLQQVVFLRHLNHHLVKDALLLVPVEGVQVRGLGLPMLDSTGLSEQRDSQKEPSDERMAFGLIGVHFKWI